MAHIQDINPPTNVIPSVYCPMCGKDMFAEKCEHLVICIEPEFYFLDKAFANDLPFDEEGNWTGDEHYDEDERDFISTVEHFLLTDKNPDLLALRYNLEGIACGPISDQTLYVFDFSRVKNYSD